MNDAMTERRILVTGGAGFIGSALVRELVSHPHNKVLVYDKLTYGGHLSSLDSVSSRPNYVFEQGDICDVGQVRAAFARFCPDLVFHLAAESHVDRSIDGPEAFIQTNIVGTYRLLEAARDYWQSLDAARKSAFRFHHISTDEVFGSLGAEGSFKEETAYSPNSPYSASKASSDHLVRAWHHTFKLPVLVTNCSNNYGPYQFPEKLFPVMIINALEGRALPIYGKGENVRDWLYVEDHVEALIRVAETGKVGETYNIGGNCERRNIDVAYAICDLLDELRPNKDLGSRRSLIQFVTDRPGHDLRYSVDCTKITTELGWSPRQTFETGLRKTVQWYLDNPGWWGNIKATAYQGERLGLSAFQKPGRSD